MEEQKLTNVLPMKAFSHTRKKDIVTQMKANQDNFSWETVTKTLVGDCAGTYEFQVLVEMDGDQRQKTQFFRCNLPSCKVGSIFDQLIERTVSIHIIAGKLRR